jgi:hypothetical protein
MSAGVLNMRQKIRIDKHKRKKEHQVLFLRKKSQIKMMESIAVLLVFIILLAFIIIFYVKMSVASSGKGKEDKNKLRAIEISQLISYMPELQCSTKNIIEDVCFDMAKIQAFIFLNRTPEGQRIMGSYYYDLFRYSKITIYTVYPVRNIIFTIYDNKPNTTDYGIKETHLPITLYDPSERKSYFSMLNVSVYSGGSR